MIRSIATAGALLLVVPAGALAGELTFPLTPAESSCAEQRLAHVERRLASYGAGQLPVALGINSIWISAASGTIHTGLVRLIDNGGNGFMDFASGSEHFTEEDLAFNLLFTPDQSFLDPQQVLESQAILVRRDTGTNLVTDSSACGTNSPVLDLSCPIELKFDLSAIPGNSLFPQIPLEVNNASASVPGLKGPQAGPLPAASGTGPGIAADRLTQPCGGTLTSFDQHVFEILARTIVPSDCYSTVPATCFSGEDDAAYNLTIFRAADPHTYRVDIWVYQYLCNDQNACYTTIGALALEFHIDWDTAGHLTTGSVRVLPRCLPGQTYECTNEAMQFGIFILPPIVPGAEEELPAAFHGAPYLYVAGINEPSPQVLSAPINWQQLLGGTALNTP